MRELHAPLCCWVILCALVQVINGKCRFPHFVQASSSNSDLRVWITRTEYVKKTAALQSQHKVEVIEDKVETVLRHHTRCARAQDDSSKCFISKLLHTRYCLRREGPNKYVVVHHQKDMSEKLYTCMQFIEHNANVVQVKTGILFSSDMPDICDDHQLKSRENDWPWIAERLVEWSFCPIAGGFNFRAFEIDGQQRICNREWRPSKLESECITGEGLTFEFPAEICNPFGAGLKKKLQCWANWEEKDFMFMVLADPGQHPRYMLRFPVDAIKSQFDARLYFRVVGPTTTKGDNSITSKVMLRLKQNPHGFCYDESPEMCPKFKAQGKCESSPLQDIANYCKLSCGLCQLVKPSAREECSLSEELRNKRWLVFEGNTKEQVQTHMGKIEFNRMGEFYCKTKQWEADRYKMISVHTNGCRPRFSCMQLSSYQEIAEFQFSHSALEDLPIVQLCNFSHIKPSRGRHFQHVFRRTLFPTKRIHSNACDLNGLIFVTTNGKSSDSMKGVLTDYNTTTCKQQARLYLRLNTTDGKYFSNREYTCHSLIQYRPNVKLLITADQHKDGKYNCWIIKRQRDAHRSGAWKQIYVMENANCGHVFKGKAILDRNPSLILDMESKRPELPCGYKPSSSVPNDIPNHIPNVSITSTNGSSSNARTKKNEGIPSRSTSDHNGGMKKQSHHDVVLLTILAYICGKTYT